MTAMDSIEARNYDRGMWLLEHANLSRLRRRMVAEATGATLEVGAGTGVNVPLYDSDVTVTAIDLRPAHLTAAAEKARQIRRESNYVVACANAQELPFPSGAFDTVIGTLVFCSIHEPEVALTEIRRVLRPGGRLLLLEHVRGQTAITRRLTDWLHPLWFAMQGECHLNRETAKTVAAGGFRIDQTSQHARGVIQIIHATAPIAYSPGSIQ